MLELLKAGRNKEFDGFLSKAMKPEDKSYLNFRIRP